ncbi:hypothetical protein HMI55_006195 [Coelomomyces lativittatus]|nr:hypothetical protein HMI55_006195 [Coelomomyces lativittatus]
MSCPLGHIACKECLFESILEQKKEIERQFKAAEKVKLELEEKAFLESQEIEKKRLAQLEANISVTGKMESTYAPSKPSLPSFWIPSLTPEAEKEKTTVPEKQRVLCLSSAPHPLSVRHVFPIKLKFDPETKNHICPSCSKQFTNGLKMHIVKTCGHIVCDTCCRTLIVPSKSCNVCDKACKAKDIIQLANEGTGFSSLGNVEAKKFEVAFQ